MKLLKIQSLLILEYNFKNAYGNFFDNFQKKEK